MTEQELQPADVMVEDDESDPKGRRVIVYLAVMADEEFREALLTLPCFTQVVSCEGPEIVATRNPLFDNVRLTEMLRPIVDACIERQKVPLSMRKIEPWSWPSVPEGRKGRFSRHK